MSGQYTTDSERESPDKPRRSPGLQPRFGAFITITVALLLLFGAASRMGKTTDPVALFGIDQQSEKLNKQEEARLKASQVIGSTPIAPLPKTRQAMELDEDFMPPIRSDYSNIEQSIKDYMLETGMEAPRSTNGQTAPAPTQPQQTQRIKNYTVTEGDTWFKIAKNTLGDGNRWQEIQKANPEARNNGLRVGLQLIIP